MFASTSAIRLENTIVAFSAHTWSSGKVVHCGAGASIETACSDLFGNDGGDWIDCIADQAGMNGNFSADPLFCDPEAGDFTLRANSPCAPPGATGCGLVGALPVGCGPVSVVEETWAGIKARYRGEEP